MQAQCGGDLSRCPSMMQRVRVSCHFPVHVNVLLSNNGLSIRLPSLNMCGGRGTFFGGTCPPLCRPPLTTLRLALPSTRYLNFRPGHSRIQPPLLLISSLLHGRRGLLELQSPLGHPILDQKKERTSIAAGWLVG